MSTTVTKGYMLWLLLSAFYLQSISACEIYRFEASDASWALQGHVIRTIRTSHVSLCWSTCVWLPWCFSLNARETSDGRCECELNNSSKTANPSKLVTKQGWTYHEMKGVSDSLCQLYECKRKEDLGDGWYRYGDSSIKLFTDKKNWTDARSYCQSLGGDLLSITSSHVNDFIYDVFVQNLNLSYMQEDTILKQDRYIHYKLNGEDSQVILHGARYVTDDNGETVLNINSNGSYAKLPGLNVLPSSFAIALWVNANMTYSPIALFSIHNHVTTRLLTMIYAPGARLHFYANDQYVAQCPPITNGQWVHLSIKWNLISNVLRFGYNGVWCQALDYAGPLEIKTTDTVLIGTLASHIPRSFLGSFKHFVVSSDAYSLFDFQTIMYWKEQGVWIGLNALSDQSEFSWSDNTTVSYKNLPAYNPAPLKSGRLCAAIGKNKQWLDKHCHLKYPYLCKKPAPP